MTPSQTYPVNGEDPIEVITRELKSIRQQIRDLRTQEEVLEKILRSIAPGVGFNK